MFFESYNIVRVQSYMEFVPSYHQSRNIIAVNDQTLSFLYACNTSENGGTGPVVRKGHE
jgi:hypothetical protein